MTSPTASPRPEPVTKAGAVAGIVAAVLMLAGIVARGFGIVAPVGAVADVANRASDLAIGAAGLWASLAPVVLAVRARGKVTPLADPRDSLGRVLAVADEATPVVDELRHYLDQLRSTTPPATSSTAAAAALPALEDPATTALLGPSVYDQTAAALAAPITAPVAVPAPAVVLPPVPAPATVTGSTPPLPIPAAPIA